MKKGLPFSLATAIMKISLISAIIFSCTLCAHSTVTVGQEVYNKEISISVKEQNVKFILDKIAKASGVNFSYSPQLIQAVRKVTLHERHKRLSYVLDKLLPSLDISYSYFNNYIVLNKREAGDEVTTAQTPASETLIKTVTGKVTDNKGVGLPGVTIRVKGTSAGVTSDATGNYKINVPDDNAVLVFQYIGFLSQEVPVNGSVSLNISLQEGAKNLDEVIVVAYGKTTQRANTGALESVKAKDLEDIPAAQFTQKIQGKLAGVQINQVAGKPGQGMQVMIRGAASLSTSSAPLYVVDGFPVVGDISNINPDEIETITVLKDAAATALYGSRAAFGVVLVTTKTAKPGQTNVTANAYVGTQSIPQKGRPDMMNGEEWAQFKKESYQDLGQSVPTAFQDPSQYGKGYDWYSAMFRSAVISDYSVSINTNKENVSSAVTLGYFRQDGVLLNSYYNRFTLRANNLFKVTKNIKIGLNVAPTYNYDNTPASDGIFYNGGGLINNALLTPPIIPIRNADGSLPVSVTTPGVTTFPTPNWVRSIQDTKSKTNTYRLLNNAFVTFEPIKDLVLKSSINIDLGSSAYNYFQPSTAGRAFATQPSQLTANLSQTNSNYYSWLSENTITYSKQIKKHKFDLLGGYTAQKFHSTFTNVSGSNYTDDRVQTIDAALVKNNPYSDIQEWSLLSYLTRLDYNYDGKYFLQASLRRDGSSRFGANNKYGNFPAASVGWVASDESFLKDNKYISFLKIRTSYGIIGNFNIGNYTQYATVSAGQNVPFNNTTNSGSAVVGLGNNNLGWEKTGQLDIGLDISFFNNRVNFTYDYYTKKTTNLLYTLPVPQESGFSSFTGNIGAIKFWGHEFALNTNNLVGRFKWNTNFNISFSDNRVLALSNLSNQLFAYTGSAETLTQVGGRIGQFYGLQQQGVYVNQVDYTNSPKNVNSQVGTIKYKDVNGDGVITYGDGPSGDKTILGNPFPTFIFGFTNSFSYQNFDLSIVASGSYGNKVASMADQGTTNLDGVFNVLRDVQDRWRSPSDPGAGKYGKTTASTGDERDQFSSRFVQNGSYLTIKNITLGYSLPVAKIAGIKSIRVYTSVQQAFVFTKYKGSNPEVSTDPNGNQTGSLGQGLDFTAYPVPRTFTLGLNLNLK
jgi:TonB-linked SusC/RagA family outer membrane protein